jgi:uncharacterized linocin/CFP29 family protein
VTNGVHNFSWAPERYEAARRWALDDANSVRMIRRVIPPFGEPGAYVPNVVDNKITIGSPLSIQPGKTLVPLELSVAFLLEQEQRDDDQVVRTLTTRAAYLLGLGEDASLARGRDAATILAELNVESRGLEEQEGLFEVEPPQVARPILDSILAAIQELRNENHHGPYSAIVSPSLWSQAYKPRKNTADAPIYEIRPLLREDGFLCSSALLKRAKADQEAGVVISTGGLSMALTVPMDAHVELSEERKGQVFMRVVQQLRLRLTDKTAAVAMT